MLWLCRRLLFLWVKVQFQPEDLKLDAGKPVCYVLEMESYSNLLVLEHECLRRSLQQPTAPMELPKEQTTRSVFFHRLWRGFWARRPDKAQTDRLKTLVGAVQSDSRFDCHIIPVSIFWGTSPGREKSAFTGLFSESWEFAGRIKKLFTILFNGRRVLLQISPPLSVRDIVSEGLDQQRTVRKISRILRVHFRTLREATIGPDLSHKRNLISEILQSQTVRRAIRGESATNKVSKEQALAKAHKYAHEIAADQSDNFSRFMYRLLSWLWNRLYNGVELTNMHLLQEVVQGNEVIYVPCHRSHIDYLLMSFVLYENKLALPHIAAGINLNLPLIGPLLRRGGGFFIRRSFRGNKLYSAVFSQYVSANLAKGISLEFFVEGGRSRTGRLLQPKQGMLSMVARSYLRESRRPIVFVPVHIAYERLLEGRTYLGELGGAEKKRESVFDVFKIFRVINIDFGKVYLNFGKPISMTQHLDKHRPEWRQESREEERPQWLAPVVSDLAREVMVGINNAAVVTPINLIATVLLSTPNQALGETDLLAQLALYLELLKRSSRYTQLVMPDISPERILSYAEKMGQIKRKHHELGDIIYLGGQEAILMTYYSNNVLHLFALPALIACMFLNNSRLVIERVYRLCQMVYPYLRAELFLPWSGQELESVIGHTIKTMNDQGLVEVDDQHIQRPSEETPQAAQLSNLAQSVLQTLERFYLVIALLEKHGSDTMSAKELENQCHLMAQRISTLYKIDAPEFFDKGLFRGFISNLQKKQIVTRTDEGLLEFDPQVLKDVEQDARSVLSAQIRHSILQIIAR